MTTLDERKQRVRDAYEALGRSDGARLADLLADDVVYTVIGSTAFSGVFRGRGDVLERLFRPLVAALATPLAIEVLSLTAEDDRVVAQLQGRSKLRSGVPYDNTYCFVFRFAGTHVVEVTEYLDTALVARAFTVPVDPTALLRLMDLNMCEMFREIVRVGRGGEILETPALTLCGSPHGTAFHNMTIVRDAVDADTVIALVRDFYVRRGLAFSVGVREHADGALGAALRERGLPRGDGRGVRHVPAVAGDDRGHVRGTREPARAAHPGIRRLPRRRAGGGRGALPDARRGRDRLGRHGVSAPRPSVRGGGYLGGRARGLQAWSDLRQPPGVATRPARLRADGVHHPDALPGARRHGLSAALAAACDARG